MNRLLIFSILCMIFYSPESEPGTGNSNVSGISGTYQITQTDQPALWSNRRFELRELEKGSDKFILSGFTNQGVNVIGTLKGNRLKFLRQQVNVIPEGGDGKTAWQLDMEGEAMFKDKVVSIQYCVFEKNETTTGHVTAEKIP